MLLVAGPDLWKRMCYITMVFNVIPLTDLDPSTYVMLSNDVSTLTDVDSSTYVKLSNDVR